jgi:exonuclease VII small subunit
MTSAIPPPPNDEVRRLEEEERRIDAAIAEHERIRALQEERVAVRAKLQQARERMKGDP